MTMVYGKRVVDRDGSNYKCSEGERSFVTDSREAAMGWLFMGKPYELRTLAFKGGFSGQVWNIGTNRMVSKLTVYFEQDTEEARNKAWADLNSWARKYGIGG